jgi:transketolase
MRKLQQGGMFVLALALAVPSFFAARTVAAKTAASGDEAAAGQPMSKEDQEKLKEHNKLRVEIKKVKYPAAKATIVSHVKGIKADDKKWFDQTLPDKTYTSAAEVYSALGWEAAAPAEK